MRRLGIGLFAVMCAVAVPALMAHAQSRPVSQASQSDTTLIADRVTARPDGVLVAEGNVEILANGQILRASRVVFDDATGALAARYLGDAPAAVYLIRPDQHVAARFPAYDEDAIRAAIRRATGQEMH